MITQRQIDELSLGIWQSRSDLTPTLRLRKINEAILIAANCNGITAQALYEAQQAAVHNTMGAR